MTEEALTTAAAAAVPALYTDKASKIASLKASGKKPGMKHSTLASLVSADQLEGVC